jgi:hypothetical protein
MAPDTEPTDEELALVMREARELAIQRRATSDAWVAARLKEASVFGGPTSLDEGSARFAPSPMTAAAKILSERAHDYQG